MLRFQQLQLFYKLEILYTDLPVKYKKQVLKKIAIKFIE